MQHTHTNEIGVVWALEAKLVGRLNDGTWRFGRHIINRCSKSTHCFEFLISAINAFTLSHVILLNATLVLLFRRQWLLAWAIVLFTFFNFGHPLKVDFFQPVNHRVWSQRQFLDHDIIASIVQFVSWVFQLACLSFSKKPEFVECLQDKQMNCACLSILIPSLYRTLNYCED